MHHASPAWGTLRAMFDPISHLVEHVKIATALLVHLEAQRALAFRCRAVAHLLEQGMVFCYTSIPIG